MPHERSIVSHKSARVIVMLSTITTAAAEIEKKCAGKWQQ